MNLPAKPTGFNALSPQQQQEHRVKVGVRAEAILSQFWRDDETQDAIRTIELEGWCDVLENCRHDEIRAAWADYQKSGPRTQAGKLYKPDAGALYQIILKARPKPQLVQPDEEKSELAKQGVDIWDMTPKQKEERRKEAARIMDGFKIGGAV